MTIHGRRYHASCKFWGPQPECPQPPFINLIDPHLPSSDHWRHSRTIDISRMAVCTFVAVNCGPYPLQVQLEMSPDRCGGWDSCGELCYTLEPGERQIMVPTYFIHCARLRFRNQLPGCSSLLTVRFQGRP